VLAQVYRYQRVSSPTQRDQTKWVVCGFAAWFLLMLVLGGLYIILIGRPSSQPDLPWLSYVVVSRVVGWVGLSLLVPLSIGVAILRHHLFDIDVIINRTLVYSALAGALVLVYWGSVVLLQALFRVLTGQGSSELTIVASTLAIAALFTPLRHRIQAFIDRRFYRRTYDAAQVLAAFSARLREETDLDRLAEDVLAVVQETMQPTQVWLWLRTDAPRPGTGEQAPER
jgi:hypothetical protein